MQITSPTPLTPTFTLVSSASVLRSWQVGEILQATVIDVAPGGIVTLRIGAAALTGSAPFPLQRGQSLPLQVVEMGAQPVLKLVDASATGTHTEQVAVALRENLPRQAPLPPLFARLAPLAQPQVQPAADMTRPLLDQITQLLNRLAQSEGIATGAGLRRALNDSGVLLEAKLATPGAQPLQFSSDIKAGLLQLRGALLATPPPASTPPESTVGGVSAAPPPLRGAPLQAQPAATAQTAPDMPLTTLAQLIPHIDAALARIQLSQIASLPVPEDKRPAWMFELPVRHGELVNVFHIRIEAPDPEKHHGNAPHAVRARWSIELAFDLERLGPVHARVSVQQAHVSVSLWAERTEAVTLFNRQLDTLRAKLQHDGLEVDSLVCLPGAPPAKSGTGNASRRLLSLKA
ncbi:MAG: flagellar hook-length control protein FliK [Gammaproteobacteria bacterium]|nr:flagellar hook-length control protein FliK [Gammaproteobacteria bacterium]